MLSTVSCCFSILSTILLIIVNFKLIYTLDNGLATTPPMGWLSWERFKCQTNCQHQREKKVGLNGEPIINCISEKLFSQIADTLIKRGYQKAGYDRVNIDDCWSKKSRELDSGILLPDQNRFPNGIEYLANYMHERGLKLGIYQNYGQRTCMNYPGMLGHMETDVKTFAKWKVDMIKLDACFTIPNRLDQAYLNFSQLVQATERPIVMSCSWPFYQLFTTKQHIVPKWDLISMNCHLFRVFHDINSDWNSILMTIDFMGDHQAIFRRLIKPGSWPDPDMLMVGNPGLSVDQAQAQMAIWCILPAPLLMSNDPRDMEPEFEAILLNPEAIAINQDKLVEPGERLFHNKTMDLWRRRLSNQQMALAVLNRDPTDKLVVSIPLYQIANEMIGKDENYLHILNVFTNETKILKPGQNRFLNVTVNPTGITFLKLKTTETAKD